MAKNGKIQTFSTVRKSLNTHGTLSVYLLCRLLTVNCFQKNRFGEIVNSGSQSNSKVQSTLNAERMYMKGWSLVCIGHAIEWFNITFSQQLNRQPAAESVTGNWIGNRKLKRQLNRQPATESSTGIRQPAANFIFESATKSATGNWIGNRQPAAYFKFPK